MLQALFLGTSKYFAERGFSYSLHVRSTTPFQAIQYRFAVVPDLAQSLWCLPTCCNVVNTPLRADHHHFASHSRYRLWLRLPALLQNSFIPLQQVTTVGEFANRIGAVRALLSGADDETPLIGADGTPSLVTADSNAIAYSRTPQVSHASSSCSVG